MQIFNYYHLGMKTEPPYAAIALRTAYLLADKAICTLIVNSMINAESGPSLPVSALEKLVINHESKLPDGRAAEITILRDQIRILRARKVKNREAIVSIKQYENLIKSLYQTGSMQTLTTAVANMGFSQLAPLAKNDILHYSIKDKDPERNSKDYVPVSEVVQLLGDRHDREHQFTDISFILNGAVMEGNADQLPVRRFADVYPGGAMDANDAQQEAYIPWYEEVLCLPNIMQLNATELQAVRDQLSAPGAPFRQAFDAWIKGCVHEGWSAAESGQHFVTAVRPAVEALREAAAQSRVLAHVTTAGMGWHMHISVACLSLRDLWKFWETQNGLAENTLEKLRAADATRGGILAPILIISPRQDAPEEDKTAPVAPQSADIPPPSARRTLDL